MPQNHSYKRSEFCESTKREDEAFENNTREKSVPQHKLPQISRDLINALCIPTKREVVTIQQNMSEPQSQSLPNQNESISELSDSTKCEIDMFPHNNKELSDTTKSEAEIIPQNTRELSDSTKCEAEMISHNIRELSNPPNEKGEEFLVTNRTP
jgi:hypothetical protein